MVYWRQFYFSTCYGIGTFKRRNLQSCACKFAVYFSFIIVHITTPHCYIQDFRTSSNQPDCHNYTGGNVESTPAIEAYAAVLSGGPVGPSDQVGMANVTLIMATWYKI